MVSDSSHFPEAAEVAFTIQPGTAADIGAMALVTERATAYRAGQLVMPTDPAETSFLLDIQVHMDTPGVWTHLAKAPEDKLAGFVLGYGSEHAIELETDPNLEYLSLLMIDPAYWGHGIGGTLLDAAAQTAQERAKTRMALWTGEANDRARALYERKGYRVDPNITRFSLRQGPLVKYVLDLTQVA